MGPRPAEINFELMAHPENAAPRYKYFPREVSTNWTYMANDKMTRKPIRASDLAVSEVQTEIQLNAARNPAMSEAAMEQKAGMQGETASPAKPKDKEKAEAKKKEADR